jgi:hypothetical protein
MKKESPPAPVMAEREAYTQEEFCEINGGFSRSTYFNLKKTGKGPREMRIGKLVRITREAAADWRREREAEAAGAEKTA